MGNLVTEISRIDDQLDRKNSAIPEDLRQEVLLNKKIAIGCIATTFVAEALMVGRLMKNPGQAVTGGMLLVTSLPIITVAGVAGVYLYHYHHRLLSYLPPSPN